MKRSFKLILALPRTIAANPRLPRAVKRAFFLWRDCPDPVWHIRVTSGGDADIEYQGVVSGDQPFSSAPVPFRLEGRDLLSFSNDPEPLIEYSLYVNGSGRDGFTFAFQAAPIAGEACFDVAVPEDIVVYLGSGKSPVGPRVDLATLRRLLPSGAALW